MQRSPVFGSFNRILPCFVAGLVLAGCQTSSTPPSTPAASAPAVAAAGAEKTLDPFWPADGIFDAKGRTSSWTGFRRKNSERRALFAQHRDEDRDGIVFVGDSITEGWRTLEQDFAGLDIKVVNRGISGDTTPNLLYRLQDDVLSLNPRGLVVLIGTNDLGEHTPPADVAANLRVFHARVRADYPRIPIAWCLVMPRKGDDTFPERIRELNARIHEIAAGDNRVVVCDTFTPLALPDGSSQPGNFVPDRLHLNSAGYAAWKSVIFPILSRWDLHGER